MQLDAADLGCRQPAVADEADGDGPPDETFGEKGLELTDIADRLPVHSDDHIARA
jgi:hypothetical protein